MDQMKLRPYDGLAIAGFFMLQGLLFTGPAIMTGQSANAAWMSVLGAHFAMLCVFLMVSWLMSKYGGKDLILVARAVIGRPVGILYGVLLTAYFCFSTGLLLREGAEIFTAYGLNLTPVYIVVGLVLISAVVMNFFGGKAVLKSVGFFFIIVLLGIIFIMTLGLNRYNPDYIFPVLGYGWESIARGAVISASMIEGVIVIALFAPDFDNVKKMGKAGVFAILISGAVSALFYLCLVMMFTAPVSSDMVSGFMEMGKSIYYNRFFYRFESAMLFFLVFSSVLMASLGLFIARKSAAISFGARSHKTLAVICAIIIFVIALIPQSLFDLTGRYLDFTRRYGVFFMAGFPLSLFVISGVKRLFKK